MSTPIPSLNYADTGPMVSQPHLYAGSTGSFDGGGSAKLFGVPMAAWLLGGAMLALILLRGR